MLILCAALEGRGLMDAYRARPPYQCNDYIGWITRTKQDATKQKRLQQMLDKLQKGGVYMQMNGIRNNLQFSVTYLVLQK